MLSEKRLLQIAVIVALLGTVSLYLYSANQSVSKVKISDIEEKDLGANIKTEGVIDQIDNVGSVYKIVLKERNTDHTIVAMVDKETMDSFRSKDYLVSGATLVVTGKLESYQGKLNLKVSQSEGLELKERAYSSFTSIDRILQEPDWYEDMNVTVRGSIEGMRKLGNGTLIELAPLNGSNHRLEINVESWDYTEQYGVVRKDIVEVQGKFVYDSFHGRWKILTEDVPEVH